MWIGITKAIPDYKVLGRNAKEKKFIFVSNFYLIQAFPIQILLDN